MFFNLSIYLLIMPKNIDNLFPLGSLSVETLFQEFFFQDRLIPDITVRDILL